MNKAKILEKALKEILITDQCDLELTNHEFYGRILNQNGCFTQTLTKQTIEGVVSNHIHDEEKYFYKIFIPYKDIRLCKEYLLKKNIDVKYIFPDLEGNVRHCNEIIATKGIGFGGTFLTIEHMVLCSNEINNTKKLLSTFLYKDNDKCDLKKIAEEINKLRFEIEKILLSNEYPHDSMQKFLKAYINN